MARADAPRERIGEMLVSLGLVTKGQLDEALQAQSSSHLPLGKQLVALGAVSETRLTQVLSNQLSVPWVSLERVEFPAELLKCIPAEIADRCSVMPVYVRSLRGKGATLYIAMDDPTDEEALRKIAETTGLPVRPMIAPPSEIRRVIEQRYFGASAKAVGFGDESTGLRSVSMRGAKQFAPPDAPTTTQPTSGGGQTKAANGTNQSKPAVQPKAATQPKPPAPGVRKPPPPPGPTPQSRGDGTVATDQYETPSQPPPGQPAPQPSRTLTLLDGTQIQLPTGKAKRTAPEVSAVRHVVKAIRSARTEAAPEEVLRWHDIVQVVLEAFEAKGMRITRQEIGDAWRKQKARRDQPKAQ
jgi:type IV pilus assembly protein PilB